MLCVTHGVGGRRWSGGGGIVLARAIAATRGLVCANATVLGVQRAPAARPWTNRQMINSVTDGARAQSSEATAQTKVEEISSRRRPQASDIGPRIN